MPLAELIGQDEIRERLRLMLAAGRLPQALLLSGPSGVGKETAALVLMQALCCRDPQSGDACGRCSSCLQIKRYRHPDVLSLRPENRQLKLAQINEAKEFISHMPVVGERRIVMISQAEAMNPPAANALLKTLEEPYAGIYFILLSRDPQALPATILSRCQRLVFRSLGLAEIARILQLQEYDGRVVGEDESLAAASWAGGSVDRARFFLDPDQRQWSCRLLADFAALPQQPQAAALALAEEVADSDFVENAFYLLQGLLHDARLSLAGKSFGPAVAWAEQLPAIADLGPARLATLARELTQIKKGLAVNVNLKIALQACFLGLSAI